ncbi:vitamin K epoxide reductase family protein [Candidatus Woesearchaeota archaeon]|jgi:uncharacterized membrane protein|nr:vitamin K epoxide reductase family protein [Candidatus Woesearchaeota archaeon]MBT4150928.1 vitamin K epoxide reductase family protein [Candidatus Woesearchaeota archaeon]MBT4247097.1 vitamin K epoxide reductase family protein [Candidatus Woesearchaeota archaeon]MBT4433718.1 vitamin K epoxide reductase family protein [Candidatus Woesearchaeota archaeon]
MKRNLLIYAIIVLSLVGLFTSVYLFQHHYALLSGSTNCDLSETISCDIVNGSVYAEILYVPVALLGLLWFVVMIFLTWHAIPKPKLFIPAMTAWSGVGFLFLFYLVGVEILLRTICPYCTIVHIIVFTSFVISLYLHKNLKNKYSWKQIFSKLKNWIFAIVVLYAIPFIYYNFFVG